MMNQVIDEHGAKQLLLRPTGKNLVARAKAPCLVQIIRAEAGNRIPERFYAFVEMRDQLRCGRQCRSDGSCSRVEVILRRDGNAEPGELGYVGCELADRARLLVRLPIAFSVGEALENLAGRGEFLVEVTKCFAEGGGLRL